MFNFAYVINLKCNKSYLPCNVCRITWGIIWIFQNGSRKFCMKSSIQFFTIILTFLKKKIYFPSDQFSLLMYRCLLPSSAAVKMDNEENMENARYATNDDTPL